MQLLLAILTSAAITAGVQINAPDRVNPGDPAILSASFGGLCVQGLGDDNAAEKQACLLDCPHLWLLVDSNKTFLPQPGDQPAVAFWTNDKGRYTFVFVCHLGGKILSAKHVLTVGVPPPAPGPPGPQPGPTPSPSRFGIAEQARQWIAEVPSNQHAAAAAFGKRIKAAAEAATPTSDRQTLVNEMVAAANAMGPPYAGFRAQLRQAFAELDGAGKFATPGDVAAFLLELASAMPP